MTFLYMIIVTLQSRYVLMLLSSIDLFVKFFKTICICITKIYHTHVYLLILRLNFNNKKIKSNLF